MRRLSKKVTTEESLHGYLIFCLRKDEKASSVAYAYSKKHKHWVQIIGFGSSSITIVSEEAGEAKEKIAAWCK